MSGAVSRETPAPPPAAAAVFGPALDDAIAYARLLATDGVERGLLGPREISRLWDRHLLNCAVVADAAPSGADVADIGSGAGLPGLVWALQRRDLTVTVVEPMLRRSRFLAEVVRRLDLGHVTVRRARAEELETGERFDVVTARAVAPLGRLLDWCLPLVRPGGELIAIKGAAAAQELDAARSALDRHGATSARLATYGRDLLEVPARAVVVTSAATPSSSPGLERE